MSEMLPALEALIESFQKIKGVGRKSAVRMAFEVLDFSEEKATEILSQPVVIATADVKMGDAKATAWGCDLTHGYITINADYRS
jgi:N-acetylglutamate synthase/N-acetylornithine aminotransferase